jgi:hypothetical protein
MLWIYFNENNHSTDELPVLTIEAGAFKDTDGNSSQELTADDNVEVDGAEPLVSILQVENTTTTADVIFISNEPGIAYYVILPDSETAPKKEVVKDGLDSNGDAFLHHGSVLINKDEEKRVNFTGLTAATNYVVYLVAEDERGNLTFYVKSKGFTTD